MHTLRWQHCVKSTGKASNSKHNITSNKILPKNWTKIFFFHMEMQCIFQLCLVFCSIPKNTCLWCISSERKYLPAKMLQEGLQIDLEKVEAAAFTPQSKYSILLFEMISRLKKVKMYLRFNVIFITFTLWRRFWWITFGHHTNVTFQVSFGATSDIIWIS